MKIFVGYFTKMYGHEDYECTMIYSSKLGNRIQLLNSTLENMIVTINKPLFAVYKTFFE